MRSVHLPGLSCDGERWMEPSGRPLIRMGTPESLGIDERHGRRGFVGGSFVRAAADSHH